MARGAVRLETGAGLAFDHAIPLSGLSGDLLQLRMGVAVGIADGVEARLEGVGWQRMEIARTDPGAPAADRLELEGAGATSDALDATLAARVRLAGADGPWISSLQVGVTLPNAGNESGLGRDVTDVAASLLGAWEAGALSLAGEAGFAILGSPTVAGAQDDQARVGAAAELQVGPAGALAAEVRSGFGDEGPGNEILTRVTAGGRVRLGGVWLDAAYRRVVTEPLTEHALEAGLTAIF